ncbi:Gfo/Idh/MocA family oxidoreductase, partial [Rhizobium ruizarguesonis]
LLVGEHSLIAIDDAGAGETFGKEIDAIYIDVPHTGHAEWAIKAARAGKHILVEKPIALSAYEAEAVYYEAKKAGVFAGEAF